MCDLKFKEILVKVFHSLYGFYLMSRAKQINAAFAGVTVAVHNSATFAIRGAARSPLSDSASRTLTVLIWTFCLCKNTNRKYHRCVYCVFVWKIDKIQFLIFNFTYS